MRYRRLDANGDYTFGGGLADIAHDKEACAQAVKTRLLLLFGEWWERLEEGLPLWQKIIGSRDIKGAEGHIRDRILGTPHVNHIVYFESFFDNDSRNYVFSAILDTDYGVIELEAVNL